MRRWSDLAERVAATTRTSEKTALLADYLRSLTPDELPVAAVFLTGRPFPEADQRATGLGWSAMMAAITALTGATRDDLGQAYDRFSDLSLAVEDVLVRAGHQPPPEVSPSLPEVAATFAAIESASGPAAKAKLLHDLLARSDPADGQGDREGPRWRTAHRPPGGTRRGGDRPGIRPPDRGREMGRDAHRRYRPARGAGTRRSARRGGTGAVPPAEVHARLAGRGRGRDHHQARPRSVGRGQVRRYPRAAPQARDGRPAVLARPSRRQQPVPRDRRCGAAVVVDGRDRRGDPRLQGRLRPAVHQPAGTARSQGAVGGDPGGHSGDLRGLRPAGARPGRRSRRRHDRRSIAPRAASRAARSARRDRPATRGGWRPIPAVASRRRA